MSKIDDKILDATRDIVLNEWNVYRKGNGKPSIRSFSTHIEKCVNWTCRRMLSIPHLAHRMGFEVLGDEGSERLVYVGKSKISRT